MANNSTPDVYLLLGVEGGSNIGKGSGLLISTQLKQIMEQVEETITSHLKIKLDQNALNDLKTQINSTVTEALTSIKGTPVELSFSFDQKSIDAAFSKVKKEMKEQQLVFSSQSKEKKETGKSGAPASAGNVSKEAAEAKQAAKEVEDAVEITHREASDVKQELKEIEKVAETTTQTVKKTVTETITGLEVVIDKALNKINKSNEFDFVKSEYSENIKKFADAKKRAFSTEEIALFDKALDLAFDADTVDGIVNYFDRIKDKTTDVKDVIQTLSSILSRFSRDIISTWDPTDRYAHLSDRENDLDVLSHFLNSRRSKASRESGYVIDKDALAKWWQKNTGFGNINLESVIERAGSGIEDAGERIKAINVAISQEVDKLIERISDWNSGFKLIEETGQLVVVDYEKIAEEADHINRLVESETKEILDRNAAVDQVVKHFGLEPEYGSTYEVTLEQIREIKKELPEVYNTIKNSDWEKIGLNGQSLLEYEQNAKDIAQSLNDVANNAQPIVKNVEKEIDGITESAKEATKAFDIQDYEHFPKSAESFKQGGEIIIRTYQDMQRALEEYKKSFHIEDNPYFPSSVDSFRPSSTVNPITSLPQLQETTKALSQNVTPVLMLPEVSTATKQMQEASQVADVLRNKMQGLGSEPALDNLGQDIEDVSEAFVEMGNSAEEAASKAEKLNKTTLNQINKLKAGFGEHKGEETDSYNEILKLQEAITTGNYVGTGFDNANDALARMNELIPVANRELKNLDKTARETAKNESDAQKKEEKTFKKLEETLAKTDARVLILKNDLSNLSTSQFDASDNKDSLTQRIAEVETLRSAIIEYVGVTDRVEQEKFWAQKSIPGVTNLTEAVDKLNTSLATAEARMKETQNTTNFIPNEAAISAIERYNKALRDFQNTEGASQRSDLFGLTYRDTNNLTMTKEQMESLVAETNRLTSATRELSEQHRREENVMIQRNKIYQEADNYYKKYQSGIKANITLNQRWLDLINKIDSGGFGTDNESARRALAELQTATKEANAETMSLWGSLKKLFTDHFGSVSATAFIGTLRNVMRMAYQNVLDIDKAMTELRKVTDLTEQQYVSFMDTAAKMATKVGGTIADTISSVSSFSRLGYNLEDSEALAEAALVYKNVGDGISDITEASESIISTIKAFKDIDASDAMSIVDRFNRIGNEYSISAQGAGEALRRSAAALAAASNDINQSLALAVAGNTVIQDPDVVGTTLKTVSMYLRAAKTDAEEAGIETEGMAQSVAKLQEDIKKISGVDIMIDDKNFKSTYQILDEISQKWDEIADVDRANLLNLMGGKRNANVLSSIIENFDEAREALITAQNAEGSALAENEKYLNSIEGHINRLKVSYEDLSKTVIDSDLIKGGADFLTNLIGGLNGVTKIFGTLPTLIATATAALSAFGHVGRGKLLPLMEYADCNVVVTRNELMTA